ncbi:hypothetical protein QUF72_15985 [Desulfobacterales bacterium HSG2]|nr:hypothetical protein [Desulfobacterales bacterium HSG2]
MNIDSIANLIQASDVSTFRTLALQFLNLVGYSSVHLCDGPYDGGKELKIYEDETKGLRLVVQISVEKDWRKKIEKEIHKIRANYNANHIIFVSSRRVPERSFQGFSNEILLKTGVYVIRYDNQAISSEFVKKDRVDELLDILGIKDTGHSRGKEKYFSPKHEAIASVLIFGEQTKAFRDSIFDSLIKSYLFADSEGLEREALTDRIINDNNFGRNQAKLISSHIDRLLQKGDIEKSDTVFKLRKHESDKFSGLRKAGERDFIDVRNRILSFFNKREINLSKDELDFIVENLTEFTLVLYRSQISYLDSGAADKESYLKIRNVLSKNVGSENVDKFFEEIAGIVSDTPFGQRIAATALCISLLNTDSDHLLNALGGRAGANIYLDSSVVIPMLCGLLFDVTTYRYGYSAKLLYDLIKDHDFKAFIPNIYVEEIGTHLIEACRDYKYIIGLDDDLSFSKNAFVSHYTHYLKKRGEKALSFKDYVSLFGISLDRIRTNMSEQEFYQCRNSSRNEISQLLARYGIKTVRCDPSYIWEIKSYLTTILNGRNIEKPDILIEHDATVIKYLYDAEVSSSFVKILCTWDTVHFMFKAQYNHGYEVLNPVALIDLFSLAKPRSHPYKNKMTTLVDFAKSQSSHIMEQGAGIWDEIVSLEKDGLADAELLLKAKEFKNDYMAKASMYQDLDHDDIARAWDVWKKNKSNITED